MVTLTIPRCPCLVFLLMVAAGFCRTAGVQAEDLPLRRVVLFTAGVGFFERGGEVEDTTSVELVFDTGEINDLLKSLVVQDLGGGVVSRVTYGSPDPLTRALRAFSVDLSDNPTLADLLSQLRGTRVRVKAPEAIEGTIVGLEVRTDRADETLRETQWLNLLTEEGLQSLELSRLLSVKVLDEQLNQQLQQALAAIARSRQEDKRRVSIEFRGEGRRRVTVGYIREFPVWKTSYRLVLADDKPPFLQGWAIVENTTDEDWQDVQLTLVSGRPVSFVMELDEPLYVARPHVMPELYGSVAPRVHDRGRAAVPADAVAETSRDDVGLGMGGGMAGFGGMGGMGGMGGGLEGAITSTTVEPLDLEKGVAPDVAAEEVGELFRYEIQLPVALARNQSAMFPIVNQPVASEKISIYNAKTHTKHPMRGLKLTNVTDLHLMQGPITIFDGGVYAGDGQIRDLAPGAMRLVSYALNLDLQVTARTTTSPQVLAGVGIKAGTVVSTHHVVRTTQYTVDSEAPSDEKLIVEHPTDTAFQLLSKENLEETTADTYRFAIVTQPATTVECNVREEQTTEQQIPWTDIDDGLVQQYLTSDQVSETVKEVLKQLLSKKREQAANAAAIAGKRDALRNIESMQARIRDNMQALEKTSELYQQYVRTLTEQEREFAELTRQLQELEVTKQQQDAALDQFVRETSA